MENAEMKIEPEKSESLAQGEDEEIRPEETDEEDDDEKITLASWLKDVAKHFSGGGKKIRILLGDDKKSARIQIIHKGTIPRFSPAGVAEMSEKLRTEDIDFDFAVKADPSIPLPPSLQLEGDSLKRFQTILRSAPNDQAIPELEFKRGPSMANVQSNQLLVDWTWQTQKPGRVKEGERPKIQHRLPNLVDFWLSKSG